MRGRFRAIMGAMAVMVALGGPGLAVSGQPATPVSPAEAIGNYTPGTVMTELGPVEVPENPQRVVVLSEYALDTAVSVGVTPVGAISTLGQDGVAPYIASDVPDVTIVGKAGAIDVEAIRKLAPDLILASWRTDDEMYAALSEMAPTIVPPSIEEGTFSDLRGWEYDVLVYAHALGKADAAAAALQEMHDRASAMQIPTAGQSAAVVQWTDGGGIVLTSGQFSSVQLYRVGFAPVDNIPNDPLSAEALDQIDADWLFIAPMDGSSVPEIESKKVIAVDGSLWTSTAGPIAADRILDDIEKAVEE